MRSSFVAIASVSSEVHVCIAAISGTQNFQNKLCSIKQGNIRAVNLVVIDRRIAKQQTSKS